MDSVLIRVIGPAKCAGMYRATIHRPEDINPTEILSGGGGPTTDGTPCIVKNFSDVSGHSLSTGMFIIGASVGNAADGMPVCVASAISLSDEM